VDANLAFPTNRPGVLMLVGLQGAGKTTAAGKLALFLSSQKKRKPLLVAADTYRPAAVDQLKTLGARIGIPVFSLENQTPVEICRQATYKAIELGCDTLILDTAGRLTIDEKLMQELMDIKKHLHPDHILLACDAMMGQDAVTTAQAFNQALDLTGFIMTKLDGDARGGAALSIKQVTGKPIKFLSTGEDLTRLEEFRPEGLASRILGMGDILGLMSDFEKVAGEERQEDAMRILEGQFTLKDFYEQITMIQRMGPLQDLMSKLPMQHLIPKNASMNENELLRIKAMIDSMTAKERLQPDLISESRARRIARGSGRNMQEVAELLKKFKAMRSMMGKLGKGLMGKIPGLGSLSQMNQLRKMASATGGEGEGGLDGLFSEYGLNKKAPGFTRTIDRDKVKKARKDAKKSRNKRRK
jgi:signal recognition particle subunit SRP54